jgi:hypothetical protein
MITNFGIRHAQDLMAGTVVLEQAVDVVKSAIQK